MNQKIRHAACGVAQKFAVSAEHFAFLADIHSVHQTEIDLLSGDISPPDMNIERNRIHVNRCVEYFKNQLVELVGLSVLSAILAVKFTDYVGHGSSRICKAEFLVTITECDGRKWYGEFYTPEQTVQS